MSTKTVPLEDAAKKLNIPLSELRHRLKQGKYSFGASIVVEGKTVYFICEKLFNDFLNNNNKMK